MNKQKEARLRHKLLLLFSTAVVLIFVFGAMATTVFAAGECYENYTEGEDPGNEAQVYGVNWQAQSFTVRCGHYVDRVTLMLYRLGAPDTVTIAITITDTNGHPTGADLTSTTFNGNTITANSAGEWYTYNLPAIWLEAETQYAIILRAPSGDLLNQLLWFIDLTAPTYVGGNGILSTNEGTTWWKLDGIELPSNEDFMFSEWNSASSGSVLVAIIPFVWAVVGVVAVFKFLGNKGMMATGIGLLMVGLLAAVGYVVLNAILS